MDVQFDLPRVAAVTGFIKNIFPGKWTLMWLFYLWEWESVAWKWLLFDQFFHRFSARDVILRAVKGKVGDGELGGLEEDEKKNVYLLSFICLSLLSRYVDKVLLLLSHLSNMYLSS